MVIAIPSRIRIVEVTRSEYMTNWSGTVRCISNGRSAFLGAMFGSLGGLLCVDLVGEFIGKSDRRLLGHALRPSVAACAGGGRRSTLLTFNCDVVAVMSELF